MVLDARRAPVRIGTHIGFDSMLVPHPSYRAEQEAAIRTSWSVNSRRIVSSIDCWIAASTFQRAGSLGDAAGLCTRMRNPRAVKASAKLAASSRLHAQKWHSIFRGSQRSTLLLRSVCRSASFLDSCACMIVSISASEIRTSVLMDCSSLALWPNGIPSVRRY